VVVAAFWEKYPNASSPHVVEVDTYHRQLDASGELHSFRLIKCSSALPQIISKLGVPPSMIALEQSLVSAASRVFAIRSVNITGAKYMTVEETCTYTVHPDNLAWTLYRQEAEIIARTALLVDSLESHFLKNLTLQAAKGVETVELIIQRAISNDSDSEFFGVDASA
jgi:hypothetical protein